MSLSAGRLRSWSQLQARCRSSRRTCCHMLAGHWRKWRAGMRHMDCWCRCRRAARRSVRMLRMVPSSWGHCSHRRCRAFARLWLSPATWCQECRRRQLTARRRRPELFGGLPPRSSSHVNRGAQHTTSCCLVVLRESMEPRPSLNVYPNSPTSARFESP